MSFDVIIVGAGTAGTTAARFSAQNGLKVCLIDNKPKERVGDKICGDGCGTEVFEFLNIDEPKGEEVCQYIKGFKIIAPNLKKVMYVNDRSQTGFVVDRLKFGQRLLNEALDAGVSQFHDKTKAIDLLYKDGAVCGVKIRQNGEIVDLYANIIIDASGVHSILRKRINSSLIEKELADEDGALCYREIIELKEDKVVDPEYLTTIKDPQKTPGGIVWYFPRGEKSLNIGLGVLSSICKENKGTLKERYKKYIIDHFIGDSKYKVIATGGEVDPLRRPLWSSADNGIMFIGDAAFQVNPIDGGGIDPSMKAGFFAANNAKKAIEKEDYSLKTLWSYNNDIMTGFGASFAALDIQKPFYEWLSRDNLNFIYDKEILTGDDIAEMSINGILKLSFKQSLSKLFKGISRPGFLLKFNYLRRKLNQLFKHYHKFPESLEGLGPWKAKTLTIYNEVNKKFS